MSCSIHALIYVLPGSPQQELFRIREQAQKHTPRHRSTDHVLHGRIKKSSKSKKDEEKPRSVPQSLQDAEGG